MFRRALMLTPVIIPSAQAQPQGLLTVPGAQDVPTTLTRFVTSAAEP